MYSGYYGPASVASSSSSNSSGSSRVTASSAYIANQQTLYSPSLNSPPQQQFPMARSSPPSSSTGTRDPRRPSEGGSDDLWMYVNQEQLSATADTTYLRSAASPFGSPSSSASSSSSGQTVTFTSCPKCNTVEHHFIQSSRTCGRCGHTRYFVSSFFLASS